MTGKLLKEGPRALGREARGLIGVEHRTARGWERQPEWLAGLLRIAETVANGPEEVRRRAVVITPHPSQVVALLVAHLALSSFQARQVSDRWWQEHPSPAAVRVLNSGAELLVLREVVSGPGGDFSLRFAAPDAELLVPSASVGLLDPIPVEDLTGEVVAQRLNFETAKFRSILDFLGREGVRYALGGSTPVAVVGRKNETRAQLEQNWVRNQDGGSASLAAIARVEELAHASSARSRWLSADDAASGDANEGSLLILNGGQVVTATVHDLDEHPWIAVLDRASTSLGDAVAQVEQYYFSVETRRLELPEGVALGKGHEVLLFEELA